LTVFSPLAVDHFERKVLVAFAVGAVLIGVGSSVVLAAKLDDRTTIPTDYWKTVLTIAGVSALPIVAMAVLVVRASMQSLSPLGPWGVAIVIGGMVAFAATMSVILICLFQIVAAADTPVNPMMNSTPAAPDRWVIWVATVGTGITLAGAAVGVAASALNTIDDGTAG
jgi:hypothetical protein